MYKIKLSTNYTLQYSNNETETDEAGPVASMEKATTKDIILVEKCERK